MQNGLAQLLIRLRTISQESRNLLTILCHSNTTSPNFNRTMRNETLSFLPAESRAALNNFGHFIDVKLAQLKQGSAIETERFRQAQ
jgi:hypothetical protein